MMRQIAVITALAGWALPALAASPAEAQAAYAAAQAAQAQAVAAKAAWVPAETALAKAKKALEAKQWDEAESAAKLVQTLAKLSMQQAIDQKPVWRNAVLR